VDLTDAVKGHQQYWLRLDTSAEQLTGTGLTIRTVCQMNASVIPRLRSGTNRITYAASGQGVLRAGPNRDQALAHLIAGEFDKTDQVTMELSTPRGEPITSIFAASHNQSGNPPAPDVRYAIDFSLDKGVSWMPVVKEAKIERRAPEPNDLWSQSFTYGQTQPAGSVDEIQVRFRNSGRRSMRRAEAHLLYRIQNPTEAVVTFAWTEDGNRNRVQSHGVESGTGEQSWSIETQGEVETQWVEISAP
jgi:hypothetical protein